MPKLSPITTSQLPLVGGLKILFPVSCFLFLAIILSGCKVVGTSKPAALQVTSTPEASIFLDGKHLGKTPFFSDQLKSGEHTLKLAAGQATFIEKIPLNEGALTVVNRELSNNFLAQSGEILWLESGNDGLVIISNPSEAEITIDGRYFGITPSKIDKIEEGDHKIILSKSGFAEREFTIKTGKKSQLVANVNLASIQAKNTVTSSSPQEDIKRVQITKTPQGFLRVRNEPSLTAREIGRVNTGDQLEVIQETEEWIKIQFEGKQGWISVEYAKFLN